MPGASVVAVGAVLLLLLSLVSGSGLMLLPWLHLGLFDVVCVALFPPPQCAFGVSYAGSLGPCMCAPVLASLVRACGLAFCLGVRLLGFPAIVCAVTPFPTISSLCNSIDTYVVF